MGRIHHHPCVSQFSSTMSLSTSLSSSSSSSSSVSSAASSLSSTVRPNYSSQLIADPRDRTMENVDHTSSTNKHQPYLSPFRDMFENMEHGGPTALGTTEFVPPNPKQLPCGVYERDLRFTTTTYGRFPSAPYVHPNEHRVTLSVNLADLPLHTPTELAILREIVGMRRFTSDGMKLSLQSNQFGSRIENKRHLVSMLDRIVSACQRMASAATSSSTSEEEDSPTNAISANSTLSPSEQTTPQQ
jgi:hypothetical protein